ncbi:MAG: hypothetical protein AAGA77_06490 [Bacteroidota bacterium]
MVETMPNATMDSIIRPVIDFVEDIPLKKALTEAFEENKESIETIESFFSYIPEQKWDTEKMSLIFNSWKASHLKMLGIYGLTCRLSRMAQDHTGPAQLKLLDAASLNAETSYEDLGLDFDGETHAELYNQMVSGFLNGDTWTLGKYTIPEATHFKSWVYRNMVVEDIQEGLFTNMFSEIYNHGEYVMALNGFSEYLDKYSDLSPEEKSDALTYIRAHIEDDTEKEHFKVVVKALKAYSEVSDTPIDYNKGKEIFSQYLQKLSNVMSELKTQLAA